MLQAGGDITRDQLELHSSPLLEGLAQDLSRGESKSWDGLVLVSSSLQKGSCIAEVGAGREVFSSVCSHSFKVNNTEVAWPWLDFCGGCQQVRPSPPGSPGVSRRICSFQLPSAPSQMGGTYPCLLSTAALCLHLLPPLRFGTEGAALMPSQADFPLITDPCG